MKRLQKLVTCLDATTLEESTQYHSIWFKKRDLDLFDHALQGLNQIDIAPLFSSHHDAIPKEVEQALCTKLEPYNPTVFLKKHWWSLTPILLKTEINYYIASKQKHPKKENLEHMLPMIKDDSIKIPKTQEQINQPYI